MDKQYVIKGDRNQAVQGDHNVVSQSQSEVTDAIAVADVLDLFTQIQQYIEVAELPSEVKSSAIKRLEATVEEVKEAEPNKELAAGTLKRMGETLGEASKTSEAAKKLIENVKPLLIPIAKWLEVGIGYLLTGLGL